MFSIGICENKLNEGMNKQINDNDYYTMRVTFTFCKVYQIDLLQCILALTEYELPGLVPAVFLSSLHEESFHGAREIRLSFWMAKFLSFVFCTNPLFNKNSEIFFWRLNI